MFVKIVFSSQVAFSSFECTLYVLGSVNFQNPKNTYSRGDNDDDDGKHLGRPSISCRLWVNIETRWMLLEMNAWMHKFTKTTQIFIPIEHPQGASSETPVKEIVGQGDAPYPRKFWGVQWIQFWITIWTMSNPITNPILLDAVISKHLKGRS